MFEQLRDKRVVVTGATGFLGGHIMRQLQNIGANAIPLGSDDWNLLYRREMTGQVCNSLRKTDLVIHLAGYNGGISFNAKNSADIFYENTVMGLNLLDACAEFEIPKVVSVVTSCAYPSLTNVGDFAREICREDDFLEGPPHDSVACHGYAKRNLQLASQFYRDQYDLCAVTCCLTTLYGPGDSFDPERTKVMGGLIERLMQAKRKGQSQFVGWGTGEARREFIYVEDAARDLLLAAIHYADSTSPLNVGTGTEISIRDLTKLVAQAVEYEGEISWDTSKPDGQMRKKLDTSRWSKMTEQYSLTYTPLSEGLKKTVEWYKANHENRQCA